jgi:MFS family permease
MAITRKKMVGAEVELRETGAIASGSSRHAADIKSNQQDVEARSHQATTTSDADHDHPPVDRGRKAWTMLAACWGVEAMTFGFGFSFGVFQNYYSTHEPFASAGNIAAIGTTATGFLYLGTPFVVILCRWFPRQARWFTLAGLFIASLALAMSSFCTTVPALIITQGMLFGIGGCFAYCPSTLYIDEWFVHRKGLAYGITWGAAGAGGAVFPPMLEALLNRFGFQTTVRICAGILFVAAAPLSFLIKPRLPYDVTADIEHKPLNIRFAASKRMALHQLVNVVQATGYFLPSIYLPSYASSTFGTSPFLSALTVMLVNLSASFGLMIMGTLSDRLTVTTCMFISASGVATSVLLLWGLSSSLPALYVFCVLYGLFAGSWSSTWPGIMRDMTQRSEQEWYGKVDPVMVQGHLCVGRGLGNIVSGPLSGALIKGMPWQGQAIGGYGSGFGPLIVYTGVTASFSGLNFVLKRFKLI